MATLAKLAMLALMFEAAFLSVAQGYKCKVAGQGLTWNFVAGRDVFSVGITTEQACRQLCSDKPECKGYSWRFDNVVGWCYEFAELEGIHICEDCFSGTLPTRFIGICDTDPENVMDEVLTSSDEECHNACTDTTGCMGYTWFHQSTVLPNYCFLYSECADIRSCVGCSGGSMNCFSPLQCFDYLILDCEKRNENSTNAWDCDTTIHPPYSPKYIISEDWQGAGYYRFVPPAGLKMATKSPGPLHCSTWGVLYISDDTNVMDDMKVGGEVEVKVCSDTESEPGSCDSLFINYFNIMVTKCPDNYFVYKLPNVRCASKFCGSFEP